MSSATEQSKETEAQIAMCFLEVSKILRMENDIFKS